jgi:hypothetical protein
MRGESGLKIVAAEEGCDGVILGVVPAQAGTHYP